MQHWVHAARIRILTVSPIFPQNAFELRPHTGPRDYLSTYIHIADSAIAALSLSLRLSVLARVCAPNMASFTRRLLCLCGATSLQAELHTERSSSTLYSVRGAAELVDMHAATASTSTARRSSRTGPHAERSRSYSMSTEIGDDEAFVVSRLRSDCGGAGTSSRRFPGFPLPM
jgi:hypothetical protein